MSCSKRKLISPAFRSIYHHSSKLILRVRSWQTKKQWYICCHICQVQWANIRKYVYSFIYIMTFATAAAWDLIHHGGSLANHSNCCFHNLSSIYLQINKISVQGDFSSESRNDLRLKGQGICAEWHEWRDIRPDDNLNIGKTYFRVVSSHASLPEKSIYTHVKDILNSSSFVVRLR